MDIGLFRGLITAALLLLFVGLCIFTFSRGRRGAYHDVERLPLEDDGLGIGKKNEEQYR